MPPGTDRPLSDRPELGWRLPERRLADELARLGPEMSGCDRGARDQGARDQDGRDQDGRDQGGRGRGAPGQEERGRDGLGETGPAPEGMAWGGSQVSGPGPGAEGPWRFTATQGVAPARPDRPAPGAGAGIGAVSPGRVAPGIALPADFVQLHYAIEALRSEARPVVLQFVSAGAGEGTSTVATGFAAVAASERPGAVLVVSCGEPAANVARADAGRGFVAGAGPGATGAPAGLPSLIEAAAAGQAASAAVWRDGAHAGLLRARLGMSAHPLMEIGSDALRRLLNGLGERYATVVLDCAPASSPDSAALSRHCDGTVLVVRAGVARVSAVRQAHVAVERAGGHVVGVVLNRRRRALPPWLDRLL